MVLAIAGMALALVFGVGMRGVQTGFRLGRRALDAADQEVAQDSLRTLLRGLSVPPAGMDAVRAGVREPSGGPKSLQGDAVLDADTPCADAGPARDVRLEIDSAPDGDILMCAVGQGTRRTLLDLRPRRASFAYAGNGRGWNSAWPEPPAFGPGPGAVRARRVFVRLATDDGQVEVLDAAGSGRPDLYPATAPVFGVAQ